MKRLMLGGCGCTGALALLVLTIPLLFFGIGGTSAASTTDASGGALHVIASGGGSCDAAVSCQSIPQGLSYVPSGFYPDGYTDPAGECTSWAAALWPGHHGRGVSWSGDAWEWYANAAAQGYPVSNVPSVGAVAVFARTGNDGGEWGHVAVVVAVDANRFQISEMNYQGRFVVDQRDVPAQNSGITGFIPLPADAFS